jgi:ABC-2 type transport system permease protein
VVRLLLEVALCVAVAAAYGAVAWARLPLLAPLLVALVGLATGVGLLGSLAYAVTREVERAWELAVRLLFFGTPVFYDLGALPPGLGTLLYWANPLTPFVTACRAVLVSRGPLDPGLYLHCLAAGAATLTAGYLAFRAAEDALVERA